jgi:ATP-dependent Clp protease ATP-binding subunit ClpA
VFDKDVAKIFRQTIYEANHMDDYWMDTEHLLLGILLVPGCTAAQYLKRIGLTLEAARGTIQQNRSSRPDYGPVPRLWTLRSRVRKLLR